MNISNLITDGAIRADLITTNATQAERYLEDSGRTVAGAFHEDLVPAAALLELIEDRLDQAAGIDASKKGLFYGKDNNLLHFMRHDEQGNRRKERDRYGDINRDILHAILGIDSEASELLELLRDYLKHGRLPTREKLIDESGDVLWYLALLYRAVGANFEEAMSKNIAKLAVRFPDKFDAVLATNRNEAAENAVFH